MRTDIDSITDELHRIEELVDIAKGAANSDPGASPALRAVVEEFHSKAKKARDDAEEAEEEPIREHIVELEQAGDSAKAAAGAEESLKDSTREAVYAAHEAVSSLKADTASE